MKRRYSDGNPQRGRQMQMGISTNRDSDVINGYRRLMDVRIAKNIYRRRHSRPSATGYRSIAGRANYEVTKTVAEDNAV